MRRDGRRGEEGIGLSKKPRLEEGQNGGWVKETNEDEEEEKECPVDDVLTEGQESTRNGSRGRREEWTPSSRLTKKRVRMGEKDDDCICFFFVKVRPLVVRPGEGKKKIGLSGWLFEHGSTVCVVVQWRVKVWRWNNRMALDGQWEAEHCLLRTALHVLYCTRFSH